MLVIITSYRYRIIRLCPLMRSCCRSRGCSVWISHLILVVFLISVKVLGSLSYPGLYLFSCFVCIRHNKKLLLVYCRLLVSCKPIEERDCFRLLNWQRYRFCSGIVVPSPMNCQLYILYLYRFWIRYFFSWFWVLPFNMLVCHNKCSCPSVGIQLAEFCYYGMPN